MLRVETVLISDQFEETGSPREEAHTDKTPTDSV